MFNIIKEKLDLSPDLKKKIDWAKNYTSTPITIEKGQIIKLLPTNIAYIEPHKVLINNYTFLFFIGINVFYINTLHVEHILTELEKYLDEIKLSNAIKFYIHPTFNYKLEDMPEEIYFDLEDNEKILKLIPIVKDIDNPDNLSNKFRLGIVTSTVKTIQDSF